MIYASTPYFWCAVIGEHSDAVQPDQDAIMAHVDKVRRTCTHPAVELNGSISLLTCSTCLAI